MQDSNCSDAKIDVGSVINNFTAICKRYTDVMAHKHYLQHRLFHKTSTVTIAKQLIPIIIKLEVMAHSLETAQVHATLTCYT